MEFTGKTALVLGGGGARGAYQFGVWRAMRELGIDFQMVFGTSVGSINAAMAAMGEFELGYSLWTELRTAKVFDINIEEGNSKRREILEKIQLHGMNGLEAEAYFREIIGSGGAGSMGLKAILTRYISEARVRESSVDYGLTVAELPGMLGRSLFIRDIPQGQLIDFILASSAFAPAVRPYEIDGIRYVDGGFYDEVPVSMALSRDADNIIAVDLRSVGAMRTRFFTEAQKRCARYVMIRSAWDLGSILSFGADNAKRLLYLGYLDARKAFGVCHGNYYTFENSAFRHKRSLQLADAAAKVFEADPTVIYTEETLNAFLQEAKAEASEKAVGLLAADDAIQAIKAIPNFNQKSLAVVIANETRRENITKPGQAALTAAGKLFPDTALAAEYLIKAGIV